MKKGLLLLSSACFLCHSIAALAGPSLPITKPPVQSPALLTGPGIDSAATNGQWFLDYNSGAETNRTHEFYDNDNAMGGGGGAMGVNAITGFVSSVTFLGGPGTPILAFSIQATIWNDTTTAVGFLDGTNRHGEALSYKEMPYVGDILDVKLTASFAITDTNNLPPLWPDPPYRNRQPYIEATNEDQAAWYCWSPADPDPLHVPPGGYFVPTWDFGPITQGQSATRQLDFIVQGGGILPGGGDPRYNVILQSFMTQTDVLLNRTTSLKISTWLDEIATDFGIPYPEEEPYRGSDVSVFHNIPEETLLDFGDAPDSPYPTLLASNGARHIIVPGIQMGPAIDWEADGQPTTAADGDDTNSVVAGVDDEDGVIFPSPIYAGQSAPVVVTCSSTGIIFAWVDFNANGSWGDFGEWVFAGQPVTQGINNLTINIPAGAVITNTYTRFRFTSQNITMGFTGLVGDGEVEDYMIAIQEEEEQLDFGDAMDPSYPTLLASTGACHTIVPGVMLGSAIDWELDGQPTLNADGDDNNTPIGVDDEDGVTLPSVFAAGGNAQVSVVASTAGFLDAWIDWNSDGDWADPGEQVFTSVPLIAGNNVLLVPVPVPPNLVAGGPHSRWRFTTNAAAAVSYTGWIDHGEVEDYEVRLEVLDFGDAPDPSYPTMLANTGACHRVPSAYWLGATAPDFDPDGQPTLDAKGDDNAVTDDEDGVAIIASLVQGTSSGRLRVITSTSGVLNAWIDFNADGDWADAGESLSTPLWLSQQTNNLPITVPATAVLGPTYGRFRFSSLGGVNETGLATDGEVEDYQFTIYQQGPDTNTFAITNITRASGNALIEWDGGTGATYETEYTLDLLSTASPPWIKWGPQVTGAPLAQTDTNAVETDKFYRVVAPYAPPP